MANCVTCKANCISAGQHRVNTDCISYVPKDHPKPITNADRIRATTDDEEMAVYLFRKIQDIFDHRFFSCSDMLEWLQQRVDE